VAHADALAGKPKMTAAKKVSRLKIDSGRIEIP
jgi:hypothetical protein